ncbi:MAG: DUF3310 domain-containing protein [Oscillospiraceae bacterium]|nr:DUF3310 domain-containing protein [Oscillospiraceae bacterium]
MGHIAKIDLAKLRDTVAEFLKSESGTRELMNEIINSCINDNEAVDHPAHYQGQHECIDVMRAMFGDRAVMDFCKCNAFKYRFRSDRKNGAEDVSKAEWYEDYLIQMEKEARREIQSW